jgi:hypothetical protein
LAQASPAVLVDSYFEIRYSLNHWASQKSSQIVLFSASSPKFRHEGVRMSTDNSDSSRPAITVNEPHQPLESGFPAEYASNQTVKHTVTVYLRDGIDRENVSYRPQDFTLPSPVDPINLYALIGRQSKQHVAIAHMKFGFEKLAELIQCYPALRDDLLVVYQSDSLCEELEYVISSHEGDFGGSEDLESVSSRHFPFSSTNNK